jgi:hypothetical protein
VKAMQVYGICYLLSAYMRWTCFLPGEKQQKTNRRRMSPHHSIRCPQIVHHPIRWTGIRCVYLVCKAFVHADMCAGRILESGGVANCGIDEELAAVTQSGRYQMPPTEKLIDGLNNPDAQRKMRDNEAL